jgi:hypothetical protein
MWINAYLIFYFCRVIQRQLGVIAVCGLRKMLDYRECISMHLPIHAVMIF